MAPLPLKPLSFIYIYSVSLFIYLVVEEQLVLNQLLSYQVISAVAVYGRLLRSMCVSLCCSMRACVRACVRVCVCVCVWVFQVSSVLQHQGFWRHTHTHWQWAGQRRRVLKPGTERDSERVWRRGSVSDDVIWEKQREEGNRTHTAAHRRNTEYYWTYLLSFTQIFKLYSQMTSLIK